MQLINQAQAELVAGNGDCGNIVVTVNVFPPGASVQGSINDLKDCYNDAMNYFSDPGWDIIGPNERNAHDPGYTPIDTRIYDAVDMMFSDSYFDSYDFGYDSSGLYSC